MTRWREDPTRECWGQFCYIRDLTEDLVWSAGFQPVCRRPDRYEVTFAVDKATISRHDGAIETVLDVIVSPEHSAEIRRVTLTNHDSRRHELELTSYAEVVLATHRADLAHPAFGKLFMETEFVASPPALLCRRRQREPGDPPVWAVHALAPDDRIQGSELVGELEHETDRLRFLGRGRTTASPAALDPGSHLSGTTGAVLDPIFSLRRRVRLEPCASVAYCVCHGRRGLACERTRSPTSIVSRVRPSVPSSWPGPTARPSTGTTLNRVRMFISFNAWRRTSFSRAQRIGPRLRSRPTAWGSPRSGGLASPETGRSCWRRSRRSTSFAWRDLLAAHSYLRRRGLDFDLVLLAEDEPGHFPDLSGQVRELVKAAGSSERSDQSGGAIVVQEGGLSEEENDLLLAAARVVFHGEKGAFADQLGRSERRPVYPPSFWRGTRANGTISRCRSSYHRTCSSPTEREGLVPMAANTACWCPRSRPRGTTAIQRTGARDRSGPALPRRRGSTSWPTRVSGLWCPRAGQDLPGRSTASSTA